MSEDIEEKKKKPKQPLTSDVLVYSTTNRMQHLVLASGEEMMIAPGQKIRLRESALPDTLPKGLSKILVN